MTKTAQILAATIVLGGVAATPAAADNLVARSIQPLVVFDDTDNGNSPEFTLRVVDSPAPDSVFQFQVYDNHVPSGSTVAIRIHDSLNNTNSFVVQPDGQVRLAAAALTIDRTSGSVGIGTTTPSPAAPLTIASTAPGVLLDDTSAGQGFANLGFNNGRFSIGGSALGSLLIFKLAPDAPDNSLTIDSTGFVGVGTNAPTRMLHVAGSGRIDGDVALGSSRTLKTGFGSVDVSEVLARVADLPVASWRYKTEDESRRHVGPFAEDFRRLFGLGDGRTISVIDAQGVAFAAIQGLQQELVEKEDELARLRSEKDTQVAELAARLAAIELEMGKE